MKRCVFVVFGLALVTVASADTQSVCDRYVHMFEGRNLTHMAKIRLEDIKSLPLEERNRVAVAAAKCISIKGVTGVDNERRYLQQYPEKLSPEETEYRRKQWERGLNSCSAGFIRRLAEKRLINDSRILPYLIEGLDHPEGSWIPDYCLGSLQDLTHHSSGQYYSGSFRDNKERRLEVSTWWQHWWEKNKNNHPVFDSELENRARAEVMELAQLIDTKLKGRFPELEFFKVPETLPLQWGISVLRIDYSPSNWSLPPFHSGLVKRELLPWILISCRFRSEDLPIYGPYRDKLEPTPEFLQHARTLYSNVLEGSDLIIEVRAASKDQKLMAEMELILNEK